MAPIIIGVKRCHQATCSISDTTAREDMNQLIFVSSVCPSCQHQQCKACPGSLPLRSYRASTAVAHSIPRFSSLTVQHAGPHLRKIACWHNNVWAYSSCVRALVRHMAKDDAVAGSEAPAAAGKDQSMSKLQFAQGGYRTLLAPWPPYW